MRKNAINNDNILYSVASILEYKKSIEKNLKELFREVDYIEDYLPPKNNRTRWFRLLREMAKVNGFFKKIYLKELQKYFYDILKNRNYKYFIVIGGGEFSKEFLDVLRKKNPQIICIVFFWDKFETTSLRKSYMYFDKVFTFDIQDSREKNIRFLPTFYIEECKNENSNYLKDREIDMYYMGAYKGIERYELIKKFKDYCIVNELNFNLKLIDLKGNCKVRDENIIYDKKINYLENIATLKKSKVVLDIQNGEQTGLTLRCFEAIAAEVKVITTNKNIYNYDFYRKENIIVINSTEEIERIPKDFFMENYLKLEKRIVEKYSVKNFLNELLKK